jgi:hypothetical protein
MKLSNKILIGFFGFGFLYLNAIFAEVRFTGISNVMDDNNSVIETVDISGVRYVLLEGMEKDVKVTGSDRPQLVVRSRSGNLLKKLTYKISGDTLTLSDLQSGENERRSITVFVPPAMLKGIIVNSSMAVVEALQLDQLALSQNDGRVWMSSSTIEKIQLDLSNQSYLNISNTAILDTLSATLDGSEVHVSSPVGLLQGSMKHNASMFLNDIREIQMKKDENSRLSMYQ